MNNNISNIHLELLDKKRQEVLKKLLKIAGSFVLGGGTALALQIAHRKSFDFDFFSTAPIPSNFLEKLSQVLPVHNVAVDTSDELTFFTTDTIKITFLHYPFKPYFPILTAINGLSLFLIEEIALQKAYTIGRRGEYRDYFDLYTILRNEYVILSELILTAKKVYGTVFDEKMFLQQLVYFGDLTTVNIIPATSAPVPSLSEIKSYFEELVKTYLETTNPKSSSSPTRE